MGTLSNGEHPLMLCICKDRKRKYKSIGVSLNPKFWDFEKNQLKAKCPNREYLNRIITDKINSVNEKIIRLHSEKKEFTASSIIGSENTKPRQSTTVDDVFKQFLQRLSDERRRGYMLSVKQLYNSLIAFNSHLNIYFSEIDSMWLNKCETWLRRSGLAENLSVFYPPKSGGISSIKRYYKTE